MKRSSVIIIGGGPAGLAAAIGAASEGIDVTLVDANHHLGGQAATSTLIENYMGFPAVTGKELMYNAVIQASKFGVNLRAPFRVIDLIKKENQWTVTSDDGEPLTADMVLIASGVEYQSLNATNISWFLGNGIMYGSPYMKESFQNLRVAVVGGGNSAGQAAFWLASQNGCEVNLIIRGPSLEKDMSDYLIQKVQKCENIKLLHNTEIIEAHGDQTGLKKLSLSTAEGVKELDVERLYIMIGTRPKTAWLHNTICKDEKGFILAGSQIPPENWNQWHIDRPPFSNEAAPGLFVSGDTHMDNPRRIVTAIGDAFGAVISMHKYIALNHRSTE